MERRMNEYNRANAYYLRIDYGMHKSFVEVDRDDFYNWVTELEKEFEIRTEENALSYDDDEWLQRQEIFTLIDYLGNNYTVGVHTTTFTKTPEKENK